MLSKGKHVWAIHAEFKPCSEEDNETRHILAKKTQNQYICDRITFEIELQTFS